MARKMGYRESLAWLVDNDDCDWLRDESRVPSVTLILVADIFGVDTDKAISDLARMAAKLESE